MPSSATRQSASTSTRRSTIYDAVRDALVEYARTIKVGDGRKESTDIGPIRNAPQYAKVKEYFDDCRDNGYTFALGGEIDESAAGWFVPITIVDNPPEDSRLMVEEPFGPILPLARWSDEDDVIRRANDTPWGLGATVWGRDLTAVERIGRQMETGTVWINEVHQYAPNQHFGGQSSPVSAATTPSTVWRSTRTGSRCASTGPLTRSDRCRRGPGVYRPHPDRCSHWRQNFRRTDRQALKIPTETRRPRTPLLPPNIVHRNRVRITTDRAEISRRT